MSSDVSVDMAHSSILPAGVVLTEVVADIAEQIFASRLDNVARRPCRYGRCVVVIVAR